MSIERKALALAGPVSPPPHFLPDPAPSWLQHHASPFPIEGDMGFPLLLHQVLGLEKDVLVWVKRGKGQPLGGMSGGWGAPVLTPWSS